MVKTPGCVPFVVTMWMGMMLAAAAPADSGELVTADGRDAIRALVPEVLHPYTIDGFADLEMRIVPTADYPLHPKYVEATLQSACQTSMGSDGQLIGYTAGQPFPQSDWAQAATQHACDVDPEDPLLGLKLAWNAYHRWTGGGIYMPHWAQSFWRADGDNTWKISQGQYRRTEFSYRADFLPGSTRLIPGTDIAWAETSETWSPFDQHGTTVLIHRYRDSRAKADDAWMYLPNLRRVRRISAEQKSDSLQGTDFTLEDFYHFSGYVWDQEWKFLEEREMLVPIDTARRCFPLNVVGWTPTAEGSLGSEAEFEACRFGPYKAFPFVGEQWQVRTVFALAMTPKREGHPYSRKIMWYDKETHAPVASIAYDRDGEPFRVSWYVHDWSETNGRPETRGLHAPLVMAAMVANVQKDVSNLMLTYGSTGATLSAQEASRLYDFTRLKRMAR